VGPDPLHVWGGYVVGALVVQRVVWGFVGPRHARFSDFVRSPIVAWVNLRDLLYGRACRNVGHSPGRRNDHCPPGLPGRDGDDGTHGLRRAELRAAGGGLGD
jgi:hypothetical protein